MPNASERDVEALIAKYDVRGHFEGLVFLVGVESDVAEHRRTFPRARALFPVSDSKHPVVLERQSLMSDRPEAVKAWAGEAARVLREAGHSVLISTPRRIVAAVHGDTGRLESLPFPGAVEFVPLATRSLRPRQPWTRDWLANLRRNKVYNPEVERIISLVDGDSIVAFDTYLSGEASTLFTRNAYSTDVRNAANYLQDQFEGFGFNVTQESFRADMGPNVIAVKQGVLYPDEYVIISGHYDSRASSSSSTTQRAPGANDDGSGTTAILEMARIIGTQGLTFDYSIIVAAWCGEEQGLVGSRAYAGAAADAGMKILVSVLSAGRWVRVLVAG